MNTAPALITSSTMASDAAAPVPYHRLLRTLPRHRWWKPLLAAGVLLLASGVLMLALLVGYVIFDPVLRESFLAKDSPDTFALPPTLELSGIAVMTLAVAATVRMVYGQPLGLVSSATGRLRWRIIADTLPIAVAVMTPPVVLSFLLSPGLDLPSVSSAWGTLLLLLILAPLQSAAEEYVFRGFLFQALGAWIRPGWLVTLLTVPLFVIGHDYGIEGGVSVACFASIAGWLVLRTRGLEAAIALHAVNNVVAFISDALGPVEATGDAAMEWWQVGSSVLMCVLYAVGVEFMGRRHGWIRPGRLQT